MKAATWGDSLYLLVRGAGGLKPIHAGIVAVAGAGMGARNTFGKLFRASGPEALNRVELLRAWMLLAAVGENPEVWGVGDEVVPEGFRRPQALRRLLRRT